MKKVAISFVVLVCCLVGGWYLYEQAVANSSYEGLPTVACQDSTKPILTSFQFSLSIFIDGRQMELPANIGHDYGSCLHEMFVKDSSGTVYVRSNAKANFTIGQFFDEWHKAFTKEQVMQYPIGNGHTLRLIVNGKEVTTSREASIAPNDRIQLNYQ